jgi:uncharacterized protein involved in exopolysaccharide biosynthesis
MNDFHHAIQAEDHAGDISVREFLMPLFRRKRIVIAVFLGILTAILLFAALTGPTYSSRMAILVNRERLDPLVSTEATTQMITTSTPVTEEEVNSEVALLNSQDVLEKVVLANGLWISKGFSLADLLRPHQSREDRIARAVKALARKLKIEVTTKTNLIEITYKSDDPQRSYAVLKSLGDFYTAKHVAVHRPAGSYEFFAHETERYHRQLEDAEARLRKFGLDNGVAAPEEQRTNLALQIADSVGTLHAAEQAAAADRERIRNDREQMQTTPSRSITLQATAANDKLIDDLNASLLAEENKRAQLAVKFDPQYPLVREADEEIAQTRAAVAKAEEKRYVAETTDRDPTYELLREDIAKSQADLAAQAASLEANRNSIRSMQQQMVLLDQQALSLEDLTREAKADESNYLLYLSKREQERTTDALDTTRIANVAIAVPPTIPVLPVYSWAVLFAFALGAATLLAIVSGFAFDYLDSSFQTPAQVAESLGVPVVISISRKTA